MFKWPYCSMAPEFNWTMRCSMIHDLIAHGLMATRAHGSIYGPIFQCLICFFSTGNFITSGNPNFGLSIKDQEELGRFSTWNKYTNEGDWSSIGLDAPEPYEENDIIKEYCDFWDGIGYDFILLPQNVAKLIDRLNKLHSENFDWDKLTVDDFAITF